MTRRPAAPQESPFETLLHRARKLRRKGDLRKALHALREACLLEERCAWAWTLYGYYLTLAHRLPEAQQAYRHALWLRHTSRDEPRERSTQALLDGIGPSSAAA